MTPDEADRIERRLESFGKEVREALADLTKAVSALEVNVHSPGDCDLKIQVRDLALDAARQKGIWVTIGVGASAVAATVSGLIVKFWK